MRPGKMMTNVVSGEIIGSMIGKIRPPVKSKVKVEALLNHPLNSTTTAMDIDTHFIQKLPTAVDGVTVKHFVVVAKKTNWFSVDHNVLISVYKQLDGNHTIEYFDPKGTHSSNFIYNRNGDSIRNSS